MFKIKILKIIIITILTFSLFFPLNFIVGCKNPAYDMGPTFSTDGYKIAFYSNRDGNGEIYIMNVDGSEQVNLTNNPADDWGEPSFSPDGSKIAFVSKRDGLDEIYIMNVDGSGQTRLTNI